MLALQLEDLYAMPQHQAPALKFRKVFPRESVWSGLPRIHRKYSRLVDVTPIDSHKCLSWDCAILYEDLKDKKACKLLKNSPFISSPQQHGSQISSCMILHQCQELQDKCRSHPIFV